MSSLQTDIDAVLRAIDQAQPQAASDTVDVESVLSMIDEQVAPPGPRTAIDQPDLERAAASQYEGMVEAIPYSPFEPIPIREVARGAVQAYNDAAQTIGTPGMRAQFIRSLMSPFEWFVDTFTPGRMDPVTREAVGNYIARQASMALEPAGSGLTTEDLPSEIIAMRGARAGLAAGQEEGIRGDIARGVGQSLPQFAALAATGGGGAPVAVAAQAPMVLGSFGRGMQAAIDDFEQERADAAREGRPLPEFDLAKFRQRALISGGIETGVELVGAGVGGRAIGATARRIAATPAARKAMRAIGETGAARAARNAAGRPAAAAYRAATRGADAITPGFLRGVRSIVATSAVEEGAEELATGILNAPFTYAPLSKDLSQALYSSLIGAGAGGAGGAVTVTGVAARRGISNLRDSFRPETDAERIAMQRHEDALKRRIDWGEDLDKAQQERLAVTLQSVNGMDSDERGRFLRELLERRGSVEENVERLLEQRRQAEQVFAGIDEADAAGTELPGGVSPETARDIAQAQVADIDEQLADAARDKVMAEAEYNAVAEKMLDMPKDARQVAPEAVLDHVSRSGGTALEQTQAPKNGRRLQSDMENLGMKVVWFRPKDGTFSPAFHSMTTRGTIFLNADADMKQARAKALEEMFHDIQMFRPDIAMAYMRAAGIDAVYQAGVEYATQGVAEGERTARLDEAAIDQVLAVIDQRAGGRGEIAPTQARRGAARLEQEGAANLFSAAAAEMSERSLTGAFLRAASRMGIAGRDARTAVMVLDTVARAAAVERVEGRQGPATLSPLARTLMWAGDLNISYARERPQPKVAPTAKMVDTGVSVRKEPSDEGRQAQPTQVPAAEPAVSAAGRGGAPRDGMEQPSAGPLSPLAGAPVVRGFTGPDPSIVAVAERYAASRGIVLRRQAAYADVDVERARRIADAYESMAHDPQNPAVAEAYRELIEQTEAQYQALVDAGYQFYFIDPDNDPYSDQPGGFGNPYNAVRDLRANKRMAVFATEAGFGSGATDIDVSNNPLLADTGIEWGFGSPDGPRKRVTANDMFRAVHDAMGHSLEGAGFRARGEENAWQAHVRLFTGAAVGAMTSETRGQNSWLNFGPFGEKNQTAKVEDTTFADQKVGLMPSWTWTEGRVEDMPSDISFARASEDPEVAALRQQISFGRGLPVRPLSSFTPEWRAWFGNSKVLDSEGNPLVVYHGTQAAEDFQAFDEEGNFTPYRGGLIAFFSTSPVFASNYASLMTDLRGETPIKPYARTIPVYLRITNPFDFRNEIDAEMAVDSFLEAYGPPQGFKDWTFKQAVLSGTWDAIENNEFIEHLRNRGHDGIVLYEGNAINYGIFRSNQAKSIFNERPTMAPEISFARTEEDPEVAALRQQIAELTRQMRDVQNVTAAQRANALREVRQLERRLAAAELLASQKVGQAQRARARAEREAEVAETVKSAAQETITALNTELDEAEATIRRLKGEVRAARRAADITALEAKVDRAASFAYQIGRHEGLVAGQVAGQAQIRRQEVRPLATRVARSAERIALLETRLADTRTRLREAQQTIRTDAAAAERAINFAYGMGLAKGRIQGRIQGRIEILRRMRAREDALNRRLGDLRDLMEARMDYRDVVQRIVRDVIATLPTKLRGPLAARAAAARTMPQANKLAVAALKLAVDQEVRDTNARIVKVRKRMSRRGMRWRTRQQVESLLAQASAAIRTTEGRQVRGQVRALPNAEAERIRGNIDLRLERLKTDESLTPTDRKRLRREVEALRRDLRESTRTFVGSTVTNAVSIYAQVIDAANLVQQAELIYEQEDAEWEAERDLRVQNYADLKDRALQNVRRGRRPLALPERADRPPMPGLLKPIQRANSDIYTLMLEVEGTSAGAINEMLEKLQAGKGAAALEHASIMRQLQPAFVAAGFSGIDDYAVQAGMLGDVSTSTVTVTLGGQKRTIPLGVAISIAAMDPETQALYGDGTPNAQGLKLRGSESTLTIYPTRQEIDALRAGLTAGQRGLYEAMKDILETQVRDRAMDAVYRVEGDQPPIVGQYWPRIRYSREVKGESAEVLRSAGAMVRGALTSVGFANAREGGGQPMLYDDAFRTFDRHLQVALDMIHMAQPYRDAVTVLNDRELSEEIDRRHGAGATDAMLAILANGVGATRRTNVSMLDRLTSNVTGAVLAMRPRTWAKIVVGGQIRLASEIPANYLASGAAAATMLVRNPERWRARRDEIHAVSGYFLRRHAMQFRNIVSGTLSAEDSMKALTALRASSRALRAAGQAVAANRIEEAVRSFADSSRGGVMAMQAFVDFLRVMDEQIMLTAVESRLAEVRDEGVLTGADALKEAVLRAERDFRRTQNASDEFDEMVFNAQARMSGDTKARLLFPFSSDPLKARNQLRRAYVSGEGKLRATAAVGGNIAAATLINTASVATTATMVSLIAAMFGGDDDPDKEMGQQALKQVKRIPAAITSDVLSSTLGYSGIVLSWIVDGYAYGTQGIGTPLVVGPMVDVVRESTKDRHWSANTIMALAAALQYANFPAYGLITTILREIPEREKTPREQVEERIKRRIERLQEAGSR